MGGQLPSPPRTLVSILSIVNNTQTVVQCRKGRKGETETGRRNQGGREERKKRTEMSKEKGERK